MVYEAKSHQFIGQMLTKTLSREPVGPTPSALEQQVHKSPAIPKQRRPRQPSGVPALRETGWKMLLFGCAGIVAAMGSASPAGATASISAMFPDNPSLTITTPPAPTPLTLDQA